MKRHLLFMVFSGLVMFMLPTQVFALPKNFKESKFVSGLNTPTSMAFAPDGRLFVTEQGGKLRVVKKGKLLKNSFLKVQTDPSGERGLLGITLNPNFTSNRYVYVYYTVPGNPPHNRVSRFRASTSNPDRVEGGSETVMLELEDLSGATNHNGGGIHFAKDGKLYIGVGENADKSNSQKLTNRLGKLLRINPDGSIPKDNPFVVSALGTDPRASIWAYGLRNPFTFAFDPKTGKLYINDVGAKDWEEINKGTKGANYGWPLCEGRCSRSGVVNPIYHYPTNDAGAVTGGTFYRAGAFPKSYDGSYFFGDYLQGFIKRLDSKNRARNFHAKAQSPVDIDVGPDGNLYYLSLFTGKVYKISFE